MYESHLITDVLEYQALDTKAYTYNRKSSIGKLESYIDWKGKVQTEVNKYYCDGYHRYNKFNSKEDLEGKILECLLSQAIHRAKEPNATPISNKFPNKNKKSNAFNKAIVPTKDMGRMQEKLKKFGYSEDPRVFRVFPSDILENCILLLSKSLFVGQVIYAKKEMEYAVHVKADFDDLKLVEI